MLVYTSCIQDLDWTLSALFSHATISIKIGNVLFVSVILCVCVCVWGGGSGYSCSLCCNHSTENRSV